MVLTWFNLCWGGSHYYVKLGTGKVWNGEKGGVIEGLRKEELREWRRDGGRGREKSQTPSGLSEVRAQTVL